MLPDPTPAKPLRRRLVLGTAAVLALPGLPGPAHAATVLPPVAEGPFYPRPDWRARGPFAGDWDADLTRVTGTAGARHTRPRAGRRRGGDL